MVWPAGYREHRYLRDLKIRRGREHRGCWLSHIRVSLSELLALGLSTLFSTMPVRDGDLKGRLWYGGWAGTA